MNTVELTFELFMEGLLLVVWYLYRRAYKRTGNHGLLILTWTFGILFILHTIFPLILEDVLGYEFPDPFEPHHVLFVATLMIFIYIALMPRWQTRLRSEQGTDEKAA